MKMIHRFTLALFLSAALSLDAQTNAPTNPPPAPTEAVAATNAAPGISPAPASAPKAKRAAKKSKKDKAPQPESVTKANSVTAITPAETANVKQEAVNVRGQASFIGEVITKLHKGESVTLLEEITLAKTSKGEPEKWFRISMPTNTPVWVNSHYIDPTNKTVVPKKLKVRAGPGENFSVVGDLEKGATVKEIRTVNDWIEIESPANTYAFVAADLIDRAASVAPVVPAAPEPAPEVVAVPPAPATPAVAEPVAATPAPEPIAPPVVVPAPPVEEPLPKRIVTHEGIVRRSLNVQTPSYYELESPETGKIINYLYSPKPGFTLKTLIGKRVLVTGEELIDKRWRNTPVIEIESLQTR